MDSLGTIAIVVGLLAAIIGIPAAIVQVLQYRNERQQRQLSTELPILSAVAERPPIVPPNNLPWRGEFIGRQAEKEIVKEALSSRWPLVCIDGIGGIGKTSLALEVVAECVELSRNDLLASSPLRFDGFIWTSARDRELTLNDILDTVARTLDYPGITQQALAEKKEAVRKLLQAKRYLLVIDNFETISDEGVRDFLLALPEPTKALVTSRTQDLRQAWSVSLRGMEQAEAFALMRNEGHRLGLVSVESATDQDLLRLYEGTGGAPLAMKWAIGQIKQKGQSLDTVLAYLYSARGDIFESIFARSWEMLTDRAQHVLMVMPIFAASATRDAIQAASDVHNWDLDDALGQLVQLSLVEASAQIKADERRYSIHPLTRSFCNAKLAGAEQWSLGARQRAIHHYLELAEKNSGWGNREGLPWFESELLNLLALLDWADSQSEWQVMVDLSRTMVYFLGTRGYWRERIDYGWRSVAACRYLNNPGLEGWFRLMIAWVLQKQGHREQAEQAASEAGRLMNEAQDETHVWVMF